MMAWPGDVSRAPTAGYFVEVLGMGVGNEQPGERPPLGWRTEVRRYGSLCERDQGIAGMRRQGWVVWEQSETIVGWRVTFEPAPPPEPAR